MKKHNPKSISLKSDIYLADKSPPTYGSKRHALTIFNRENKKTKVFFLHHILSAFCLFWFNINNSVYTLHYDVVHRYIITGCMKWWHSKCISDLHYTRYWEVPRWWLKKQKEKKFSSRLNQIFKIFRRFFFGVWHLGVYAQGVDIKRRKKNVVRTRTSSVVHINCDTNRETKLNPQNFPFKLRSKLTYIEIV